MKEFLKRSVLQYGKVGLTLLSSSVAGLILGSDWDKGWSLSLLNLLKKKRLSDFSNQFKMETGKEVYPSLWQRSKKHCIDVISVGDAP